MYNFDEIVERKGTSSAKWDSQKQMGIPGDVISMWVADMDFKAPPEVLEALTSRVEHGVFGYTFVDDKYLDAVVHWMKSRHNWHIKPSWVVATPGIVTAIHVAIHAFTNPGDAIIIQKPVYYPFDEAIEKNNRVKVENPVIYKGDHFEIDFEDFEKKVIKQQVKLFILCNPFNPIGKVWTKEELKTIGDICKKHNVMVISDEIHHDFVYGDRKHIPFFEVEESYKEFSIICTAPSKTFNLAGLQDSNIIIANKAIRKTFKETCSKLGVFAPTALGLLACQTAYTKCATWCDEMIAYVQENFTYMDTFFKTRIPKVKLIPAEGLYLAWVDFKGLGMNAEELEKFMLHKAKLWLDEGYIFGKEGAGFERFNLAAPRSTIKEALERLERALQEEGLVQKQDI